MPRSKRERKTELFLNEDGCKRAAALYLEECDRRDGGQNEICEAEDISPSTGTKFRRLEYGLAAIPDATTILKLGRQITDPDTGNRFPPLKFLLGICCAIAPKTLVETALQIDPNTLTVHFPDRVSLKSVEGWLASATQQEIDLLAARLESLRSKEAAPDINPGDLVEVEAKSSSSPIAELVQSHLDQGDLKPFEFARRCGLKAAQIHAVLDPDEKLDDTIAEGLARGFAYSMDGWTADLIKAIDPTRFKPDQPLPTRSRPAKLSRTTHAQVSI